VKEGFCIEVIRDGVWTCLSLGPYDTQREAAEVARELKRWRESDYRVVECTTGGGLWFLRIAEVIK
jgi:hypothetical protein